MLHLDSGYIKNTPDMNLFVDSNLSIDALICEPVAMTSILPVFWAYSNFYVLTVSKINVSKTWLNFGFE